MTNKKVNILLIIVTCVLIILGIAAGIISHIRDNEITKKIIIIRDEVVSEEIAIENFNLCPGERDERQIVLCFTFSGDYEIIFSFEETEDGGLKDYVDVSTFYAGEAVAGKVTLREAFERVAIKYVYTHDHNKTNEETLTVVYEMPATVGEGLSDEEQEAIMGAYAKFNLKLTVKRI